MIKVRFIIETEFVDATLPAMPREGDYITFRYEGKAILMKAPIPGLVTGQVGRVYFHESQEGVFIINIELVNPAKWSRPL